MASGSGCASPHLDWSSPAQLKDGVAGRFELLCGTQPAPAWFSCEGGVRALLPHRPEGFLGAEPSYADAELVEWDDRAIGPTDRNHSVTRGRHVGFRARDRAQADAPGTRLSRRGYPATARRSRARSTARLGGFLLDPNRSFRTLIHAATRRARGRMDLNSTSSCQLPLSSSLAPSMAAAVPPVRR
jgi:hypothetical protein